MVGWARWCPGAGTSPVVVTCGVCRPIGSSPTDQLSLPSGAAMSPPSGAVARVVMKGWEGGRGGSVGWVGWGSVAVQARTAVNCNVG